MGIETIGLVTSIIGTGVGAIGQMQQASAAQASANYQSQVAATNQQIATQNASFAAAEGEQQAASQQQKVRVQEGQILAGQASSGVDINSPTATGVRTSEDVLGQLDTQTIKSNAARAAYGFETQATNFGNQAAAEKAQASNDATAGYFGAGAGLLSGAGNTSLNYAKAINSASGLDNASYDNYGNLPE